MKKWKNMKKWKKEKMKKWKKRKNMKKNEKWRNMKENEEKWKQIGFTRKILDDFQGLPLLL